MKMLKEHLTQSDSLLNVNLYITTADICRLIIIWLLMHVESFTK